MNHQLNAEQLAAVDSEAPNIVVIAAPGTGKTSVLAERFARRLLMNPGAKVAAITYTIAAAKELRERCFGAVILPREDSIFIGTIHALALQMLRGPWAKFLPCPEPLTVMTAERNKRAIEEAKAKVRYKGTMKALDLEFEEGPGRWLDAGGLGAGPAASLVVSAYYQACRKASLISYDDLIKVAARLCELHPLQDALLDELLVDEYQDASEDTDKLCFWIPARSRFFIGDPRQSIFGWLGGSPERMERLAASGPWARFDLTQSYRCSAPVAAAANRLLGYQKTDPALPDVLPVERRNGGFVMHHDPFPTAEEECAFVADQILDPISRINSGGERTVAILARTNFIADQFAEHLKSKGIPVAQRDKAGVPECWEQLLAVVAAIDTPHNDAVVHDMLTLTIGAEEAAKIRDAALLEDKPITGFIPSLLPPNVATAADIAAVIAGQKKLAAAMPLVMLALARVGPDASAAALRLALADPGLTDAEQIAGAVSCITIHGAKGREWDHVFIVGASEGILPGRGSESEERRLMFVAITRARISVAITCAQERLAYERDKQNKRMVPSRFIAEATGDRL